MCILFELLDLVLISSIPRSFHDFIPVNDCANVIVHESWLGLLQSSIVGI